MGQSECPPWAQPAPKQTAARGACRRPGAVTKGCHPTGPGGRRAEGHTAENSGTLASPPLLRVRCRPLTRAGQALPTAAHAPQHILWETRLPRAASLDTPPAGPHASFWEKGTLSPTRPTLPAVS